MDNKQFEQIMAKLDMVAKLTAVNSIKGLESEEQIRVLSALGFQPSDISPIVGKTPNAVRIALHYIRKKKSLSAEESQQSPAEPVEPQIQGGT